ncbi:Nudix hydrolase 15 [Forsythia ovata]|uniref:Nudix hydrolase 15 n=1 Tax=Forsythia ovata TaxID=205694 RepID=A0ABD1S393_9LAMI
MEIKLLRRNEGGVWGSRDVSRSKSGGDQRFEENQPYNPSAFLYVSPDSSLVPSRHHFLATHVTFSLLRVSDRKELQSSSASSKGILESIESFSLRDRQSFPLILVFYAFHLKVILNSDEVSLPGGKAEETDANDAETATREAKEEIGLDPSLVNVVTCLEPFLSKHVLRVIPVIGILSNNKDFSPSPNASEVEAVFDAPLEMFLKDENRKSEEREWMGDKYLIHFFDYEMNDKKYLIWYLTAGVLIRAASIVYQKPPAFLEQIQSS